ncbi:MAG: transglutaminase domain-containing protein, partial [Lapillicoccus sp.]
VFLPGHSLARLQRFVRSEQLAGDDEQYAAALALAANRIGIQARVVFGATPEASGEVKGSDIHAWVEVHSADGTWAQVLPRDFLPDRNKQPEQQQQRSEEQKTGAQVPPPVANNPPSVLQGPDQAQNATQNRKPPPKNLLDPSNWPDWVKWLLTYVGHPRSRRGADRRWLDRGGRHRRRPRDRCASQRDPVGAGGRVGRPGRRRIRLLAARRAGRRARLCPGCAIGGGGRGVLDRRQGSPEGPAPSGALVAASPRRCLAQLGAASGRSSAGTAPLAAAGPPGAGDGRAAITHGRCSPTGEK